MVKSLFFSVLFLMSVNCAGLSQLVRVDGLSAQLALPESTSTAVSDGGGSGASDGMSNLSCEEKVFYWFQGCQQQAKKNADSARLEYCRSHHDELKAGCANGTTR